MMLNFIADLISAFFDWGRGESSSFWRTLMVYLAVSVIIGLIGFAIWGVWPW